METEIDTLWVFFFEQKGLLQTGDIVGRVWGLKCSQTLICMHIYINKKSLRRAEDIG